MEEQEETDKSEDSEFEDLRRKILERLIDPESSEGSDREEDVFQIRLSCILEDDDETDGSTAGTFSAREAKQQIPKNDETVRKSGDRDKPEETEPEPDPESDRHIPIRDSRGGSAEEATIDAIGGVQVTDLDDVSVKNLERTENPVARNEEEDFISPVETKVIWVPKEQVRGCDDEKKADASFEASADFRSDDKMDVETGVIFRDVHIRGVLQKEYNPPVPPETYLWEEIKRSREKGGYPWTYLDKSPTKLKDHEYEPVDPPPHPSSAKTEEDKEIAETEKRFVRIPLDSELVVKEEDYERDEKSPEDSEIERIAEGGDVIDRSESRCLAATPTTTASQSRTDCDINTSMLDSSGLEDLPLNRGSRNKKAVQSKTEQMRAQAYGIHQKLRSQAGKLRNKLRSLPKPSFNLKEKNKSESQPEKSKVRSPRFGLPERPKFKLPERPKFNLPERPKINLPGFGKSKTGRERESAVSGPGSRKNIFDIDFKTYPRIFSKKSRERGDYATSSPKQTRVNTPPPAMRYRESDFSADKKAPVGQKWIDDIKYADADAEPDDPAEYESRRSEKSESLSDFRDKDLGCVEDLENARLPPGRRTVSTKSSLSHLSEKEIQSSGSSEDRLRKGVLEEIDSDQFFLRQKGISQEDIDMGKYLSREIREAFKSPVANALARMDYDYDEPESENVRPGNRIAEKEPDRPTRTRSLKKRFSREKISESDPGLNEPDHYKTYPPRRPGRRSRSRSKGASEDNKSKSRYENEISSGAERYENVGRQEDDLSEYYKSPASIREYQHYKVPRSDAPSSGPVPIKRKSSSKDRNSSKKKNDGWVEVEIETSVEEIERALPPRPLTRRKSQKQKSAREEISLEPDYIVPAAPSENQEGPPVPPKRTRSMSRGSRSLRSLKLQDEEKEEAPAENRSRPEPESSAAERRDQSEDEAGLGYATVGKSSLTRPERHKKAKPQRPPPPRKKRDLSSPFFNTLPKRVPVRPDRNYSTLGPSRPPRRRGIGSAEHLYAGDSQSQAYVEITDGGTSDLWRSEDLHGSTKDLQTEEVIEKMKGRPLPPPPRPPRQKSRGPEEKSGESDYPIVTRVEAFVHEPPPGTEIVEEVCVSTQTDPLPEDSCLETDEDFEAMQEFSHEQLKIQEAFLQEMKEEEERILRETAVRRRSQIDLENAVISKDNQVIKRLEEIVAEERKLFAERQKTEFTQAEKKRLAEERLEKEKEKEEEEEALRKKKEVAPAAALEPEGAAAATEKLPTEQVKPKQEEKKPREEKEKPAEQSETIDLDMGYASLDRRQWRPENEAPAPSSTVPLPSSVPVPIPVYVPVVPDPNSTVEVLKTEKLQVKQLEVERLNVNELQANRIRVDDLQSARLVSENVTTRGGNLTVGNLELPPDFVRQILASIPWDEIGFFRERSGSFPRAPTPTSTPVESVLPNFPTANLSVPRTRSPRRRRQGPSEEESEQDDPFPAAAFRRTHRRRHNSKQPSKYSSDEEEEADERREVALRRHVSRTGSQNQSVSELSRQLARACASAGIRAARNFASTVRTDFETVRSDDKALYVQAVLCIAIVLVAGFFLLGFDSKAIYHYHWDFQFPPRPPPHGQDG